MKFIHILACVGCVLMMGVQSLCAQQIDTLPADSMRVAVSDTIKPVVADSLSQHVDISGLDAEASEQVLMDKVDSVLQSTTSSFFFAPDAIFKPAPRRAVMYSAIFPGLGQVYNRQYWKLPIIYGGFTVFTYFILWNNRYYETYFEWHRDLIDGDPSTNSWHNGLPYGRDPETVDQKWLEGVYSDRKDSYRYYRDFSIIGTVALYLLNIVDAYVDAQLFDFDMSPNLSMEIKPQMMQNQSRNYLGSSFGIQCSIQF